MDKLEYYRHLIRKVLTEYYELGAKSSNSTLESALIFDERHDHYLLVVMGWEGQERIKGNTIHVRLRDGKIWIEEDWTEDGVVTDFLQAAVPREDIVLAFHPPHLRQYTEFAIA
ncbi:MAG: XisI protein [Microcoleus sp. PH2017_29_MFU_D_A]|uniref:XisI protein n=1 Tax=unclassified Microcoleus TaxID=2642155 RepID=UPI001D932B62|nr:MULTISPECIES: XisI protein [unclassified Microcoleus]MCC3417619.1 XisI protein [Microcoleus sp. PH2017_07_MST_O_A]MCC3512706.1 XisI protein [Microcoleus sp. PH2017_17_BER_D_A]TAE09144.1 MAG: XisI protein [Oscillatoriales cyanobacterium]MCC3427038.1 XisI protein [Microcoleus sp. PH2017_01_SCD_O_A]MCC3437883.1 XisI protein [Microcoleus sp. PH2017_05_CCC_O_A]